MHQVDGATLRRWRLSRRWDVPRLAREFIKAADEPLATVRGLTHMINAWERGARRPSERYGLPSLELCGAAMSLVTTTVAGMAMAWRRAVTESSVMAAASLSRVC